MLQNGSITCKHSILHWVRPSICKFFFTFKVWERDKHLYFLLLYTNMMLSVQVISLHVVIHHIKHLFLCIFFLSQKHSSWNQRFYVTTTNISDTVTHFVPCDHFLYETLFKIKQCFHLILGAKYPDHLRYFFNKNLKILSIREILLWIFFFKCIPSYQRDWR